MKNKISIMLICICWACSENNQEKDSYFKLSQNRINFSPYPDSSFITTAIKNWSIINIEDIKTEKLYPIHSNTGLDSVIYKLEWISVQKIGLDTIKIKVDENIDLENRGMTIFLQRSNYYDEIKVTQDGRK